MEKTRNRQWRREQGFRVFKSRIVKRTPFFDFVVGENAQEINHPHWFELMGTHWAKVYKTTGTPCSCPLCRGERYDRRAFKQETRRIIHETME